MREFYFLRHGETPWNVDHRIQGQIGSVPLNTVGQQQAAKAAQILAGTDFELIVSSTLNRAAMTAQIIAAPNNKPVLYDSRLIERGCGDVEGLTIDEIRTKRPDVIIEKDDTLIWGLVLPNVEVLSNVEGAESHEALADRAFAATMDLLARHDKQRLLLVTHGGWMKGLVFRLNGTLVPSFKNAFPYRAFETKNGWHVEPLA